MDNQKRFRIATLGCRTNQYESEAYRDQLEKMGYAPASGKEEADIVIINTCTVTESADSHSRHEIRKLRRENPQAKVVVTGCLAERRPDLIQKIGGIDLIVSNKEKESLLEKVFPDAENLPEFSITRFEAHTRAFIKVQDGCNSFCTYCIIPYVRGRSRSRPLEDVVREVERLVESGYKEVVVTGINVGDYDGGEGGKSTLADLMRAVDKVPGLQRLRLSSIDPDEVDDNLMDAILQGKNTCRSMHIVLQSGSNVILKRMNRKYNRAVFLEACEKLTRICPDFTFTTDVIVGFPGETESDFAETLDVMRRVRFAKVHMFPYSKRERTRAALFEDQVPPEVIAERKTQVLSLAERIAFEKREEYVGRTMPVLLEGKEEGCLAGHTDNFLYACIPAKENYKPNDIVSVRFVENTPRGLIGNPAI